MIQIDDYYLSYHPNQNYIAIGLPQTMKTATNTRQGVANRRTDVDEKELAILLVAVKKIFEGESV